jgi:hypothetical protein
MGTYLFSNDVMDKLIERISASDLEGLTTGIKKYVKTETKTIDETLEKLAELQEAMEDRIGAINRTIRYTRGTVKLPEASENDLVEFRYITYLIHQVKLLKKWIDKNQ